MAWTFAGVDLTIVPGSVEVSATRDTAINYALNRVPAIADLGSEHGETVKMQLWFPSRAAAQTVRNAVFSGAGTLTSPYGDTWTVVFDGQWTMRIQEAVSASQEAVRTVDVTFIEVA